MKKLFVLVPLILLAGCQTLLIPGIPVDELTREKAFDHALTWKGVPYLYGGQKRSGVDCSGLIVRAYQYATQGSGIGLPFPDAAVVDFKNRYTIPIESPTKGDLIFMGDGEITHIALYEKTDNGNVYFVDAFEGTKMVSYRSYPVDSPKIHYFGRLLVIRNSNS